MYNAHKYLQTHKHTPNLTTPTDGCINHALRIRRICPQLLTSALRIHESILMCWSARCCTSTGSSVPQRTTGI